MTTIVPRFLTASRRTDSGTVGCAQFRGRFVAASTCHGPTLRRALRDGTAHLAGELRLRAFGRHAAVGNGIAQIGGTPFEVSSEFVIAGPAAPGSVVFVRARVDGSTVARSFHLPSNLKGQLKLRVVKTAARQFGLREDDGVALQPVEG
jgi:hypothetical protein